MLEPRSRAVEPATLMELLFRLSELETRISVNMNVLVDGVIPKVVSLGEALQQWLDHRRVVLLRRSRHRLAAIDKRLELLAGMIVVFLNLDEVIRIVREDDDPKEALKARFGLTEPQAVYVLDTRLRSLRRLEEMALRKEEDDLKQEKASIELLLGAERKQWQMITVEIRDVRKKFGPETKLGRRRTTFEDAPDVVVGDLAGAMIEREPLTIVVSEKGWIRAMKGQVADLSSVSFKTDDRLKTAFFAETTSKILVLTSDGKVFTLDAAKLPGGRSQGEPIRLMADIDESASIVAVWPYAPGGRRLIVASDGNGFLAAEDDLLSSTRKGRAVLNLTGSAKAALIVPAFGDHVAVIGENRKLLVFPISQLNAMARGKGTRLQRYKDGGISDARVFSIADGLTWREFGRAHLHRDEPRAQRMDRQSRRSRPPAAEGLSEEQPLLGVVKRRPRCWRRSSAFNALGRKTCHLFKHGSAENPRLRTQQSINIHASYGNSVACGHRPRQRCARQPMARLGLRPLSRLRPQAAQGAGRRRSARGAAWAGAGPLARSTSTQACPRARDSDRAQRQPSPGGRPPSSLPARWRCRRGGAPWSI